MFERQEKEQSWDVGDEFAEKRLKDPKDMFLNSGRRLHGDRRDIWLRGEKMQSGNIAEVNTWHIGDFRAGVSDRQSLSLSGSRTLPLRSSSLT